MFAIWGKKLNIVKYLHKTDTFIHIWIGLILKYNTVWVFSPAEMSICKALVKQTPGRRTRWPLGPPRNKKSSTEQRGPATLLQRQPVNNNLTHLNYSVSGLTTIQNWFRKYVKTCLKLHYTAWPVNRCARAEITQCIANRDGHLLTAQRVSSLTLD